MTPSEAILGIDCCSRTAGAVVLAGDRIIGRSSRGAGQNSRPGRELMASVAEAMDLAAVRPVSLACVAVTVGPGSMTGIRVGLATVRGLLAGSACPTVAVDTFDALDFACPGALAVIQIRKTNWLVRTAGEIACLDAAGLIAIVGNARAAVIGESPLPGSQVEAPREGLAEAASRIGLDRFRAGDARLAEALQAVYLSGSYAE